MILNDAIDLIKRRCLLSCLIYILIHQIAFFLHSEGLSAQEIDANDYLIIKSIDGFNLKGKLEPPILKVKLSIENMSDTDIRIKNGLFNVIMNPENRDYTDNKGALPRIDRDLIGDDKDYLNRQFTLGDMTIGNGESQNQQSSIATKVNYLEIPSNGIITKIVEINLPKKMEKRLKVVYLLLNYAGFLKACKDISIVGNATVGIKGENGWVFENKMGLEIGYYSKRRATLF